jgi:hypothetical protein
MLSGLLNSCCIKKIITYEADEEEFNY